MNWSTSKLELLRLCPFAFLQDLEGKPRPPQPALDGGRYAHAAIRELVRVVLADEPIDVRAIARRTVPGRAEELAGVLDVLTILQEELADEDATFLRIGLARGAHGVLYVEERLAMPIGPHTFDGQADLVEALGKVCYVTDFKTHWRVESQETFAADVQLPRYALLVDHHHPGRFERFVLRKRFVRYRGAVRELELERHHLEAVRWDLASEIEEAEARIGDRDPFDFPATPGDWCSVCARTDVCPALERFEADDVVAAIADDEAAYLAAARVRVLDAHSAKLKRLLKGYLGADHPTGRVQLSGGSYGYGPSRHKRADVDDVLEVWEAHERPVNRRALRVDVDELRRSLDREPGTVRRAMLATIEEYEQPDCRYRRGDDQPEEEEDPC